MKRFLSSALALFTALVAITAGVVLTSAPMTAGGVDSNINAFQVRLHKLP